jgi:hypothetical protein
MDLGRLTRGEAIAAASGLVLLVVMFLPWFSEDAPVKVPGIPTVEVTQETHNAWEALGLIDVLLLFVVLFALGVAVAHAAGVTPSDPVLPPSLFVTAAGLLAVILILYRLADPPAPTIDLTVGEAAVGRRIGILLGLLAATGISFGGYVTLTEGRGDRQGSQ